jgi:DNA-directed RNA polymerase specialized sigma24 family protein
VDDPTRWLLAARDGDAATFIGATRADGWRLCGRLGGADDLTQETPARAGRSLPALRGEAGRAR